MSLLTMFDLNFKQMSHADFANLLAGIADALAVHPGYQNPMPEEVPDAKDIMNLAGRLSEAVDAAQTGDRQMRAYRDALRAEGELAAALTAQWAVIKSFARRDLSYIANLGIEPRRRRGKSITASDHEYSGGGSHG